jgi:hypothetical protein
VARPRLQSRRRRSQQPGTNNGRIHKTFMKAHQISGSNPTTFGIYNYVQSV